MDYSERNIDLKEYLWIFYKHRWTITSLFVVIMSLAIVYNVIAKPVYMATIRILIEKEKSNIVDFKEIYAIDVTSQEFYQTQYKVLESRFIAREVLDKLNLWHIPELSGDKAHASDGVGEAVGADELETLELAYKERVVNRFLDRMIVQPVRNTQIVLISYSSGSSDIAAKVANAIVEAYMDYSLSTKIDANVGASGVLQKNILQQRKKLGESEKLLQEYKGKYKIVSLEEENNIAIQKLAAHSNDLVRVENERIEAYSKYQIAQEMLKTPGNADSIPEVMKNTFITKLKTDEAVLVEHLAEISRKYGDKHPQVLAFKDKIRTVRGQITAEINRVVNSFKSEYEMAIMKESSIKEELLKLKEDSQNLGKHAVAYNVLARDVQTNKQMYEVLLKRLKETSITGGMQTTNVRVLDSAVPPQSAFRPRRMLNLLLALVFGVFLGPAAAILVEYLDSSIMTPEDVERYLRIPYLGPLPDMEVENAQGNGKRDSMLVTILNPKSIASEAYRSVRTSILFSSPEEEKTILISSSSPAEGKSITSSNLAVTMAQNGSRTILLDMDFRRPVLHEVFGVSQEKGLSNLLVNDASIDEVIVHTAVPNLDIIPSGHVPPNPAELLSSEALRECLNTLKGRYDRILIDSPPIISATDPVIISTFVDEVLLVVKVGESSREVIQTAIEKLRQVNANLIGTVLNRAMSGHGNYYYQYQYYGEKKPVQSDGILGRLKVFFRDSMQRH